MFASVPALRETKTNTALQHLMRGITIVFMLCLALVSELTPDKCILIGNVYITANRKTQSDVRALRFLHYAFLNNTTLYICFHSRILPVLTHQYGA